MIRRALVSGNDAYKRVPAYLPGNYTMTYVMDGGRVVIAGEDQAGLDAGRLRDATTCQRVDVCRRGIWNSEIFLRGRRPKRTEGRRVNIISHDLADQAQELVEQDNWA